VPDPLGAIGSAKAYPFVQTEFNETLAEFSPDGHCQAVPRLGREAADFYGGREYSALATGWQGAVLRVGGRPDDGGGGGRKGADRSK